MAHRHRLESLQRLSSELSASIATPTPRTSSSTVYASPSPRGAYDSPRAFFTPPLSPSAGASTSLLASASSASPLDLPPSTSAPRPVIGGGSADVRLARLEEQQAQQAKRLAEIEAFYKNKMASLQQTVTDALFQTQSQANAQQSSFAALVAKLERKLHEVDDDHTKRALDNHNFFTGEVGDLREHLASEVEKMATACSELEARTKKGFERAEQELAMASSVLGGNVEAEAARLGDAMEGMNQKFVDICIGLDNKAVRLDDAQTVRMEANEAQMHASLSGFADELARSCAALEESTEKRLAKTVEETDDKMDRMTRQIESTNRAMERAKEESSAAVLSLAGQLGAKLTSTADGLTEAMGAMRTEVQAYVDSGVSEALTKTEYKTGRMLLEMRVQEIEDGVKSVYTGIEAIEEEMEKCVETCSELTTDLMMIETALESGAP